MRIARIIAESEGLRTGCDQGHRFIRMKRLTVSKTSGKLRPSIKTG
ncbi:MAG: hypothetical protein J0M09_06535 [Xanthomonadales bacterium]|nr:hypothetical protein [Xanthomonadales bacterium]